MNRFALLLILEFLLAILANAQDQVQNMADLSSSEDSSQQEVQRDFRYQISLHGIYMVPDGVQATDYSRPGFGGGATFIFPIGTLPDIMRGGVGIEFVNLLSKSHQYTDRSTGLPYDQETNQNFMRLYFGLYVGSRGTAFYRPYAAINLALHVYGISSDIVQKDPYDPTIEDTETISSTSHAVAGCDMTFGLDLNVSQLVALDGGFRFVKSFAVPQQLGEGSVKVYPYYFQIYLGIRAQGLVLP